MSGPRSEYAVGVACAVFLVGTTGCNKLRRGSGDDADAGQGATTPTLSAPPTPQVREGDITFRETKARVSIFLRGTSYELSFFDFPPSSKIAVGGRAMTTSATGFLEAKIDLADRIASVPAKDAFDKATKIDPKTRLELEFGPQAKLAIDAPPISLSSGLTELYKKAPATPVTIGSGPSAGAHTTLFMGPVTPEVIGPAKTVAEIDWIAVVTKQSSRSGKTCSGYRKTGDISANPTERSFTVSLVDEKIAVYELRTGRPIADKLFIAKDECPAASFGAPTSTASADEEKAWVRQLTSRR